MTDAGIATTADLFLTFDAPILRAADMLAAIGALLHVAEEVAAATADDARFDWIVETVSKSSPLAVRLAPRARHRTGAGVAQGVMLRVVDGMRTVQDEAERPEFFTDRALKEARDLSKLTKAHGTTAQVGVVGQILDVTPRLAQSVDRILEPVYRAYGSVEGRLEALNVHGRKYFAVYDDLTGDRIECAFGRGLGLDAIIPAINRRVMVEGEISYRRAGDIASVRAESIRIFRREHELPSAHDVLGILKP
jgi:hypothetical protein